MKVKIKPISIHWYKSYDPDEPLFWYSESWQCAAWTLDKTKRVDFYGFVIRLLWVRIYICTVDFPFESPTPEGEKEGT